MPQNDGQIHGFTCDQAADVFCHQNLNIPQIREWVYSRLHPDPEPTCPGCSEKIKSSRAVSTFIDGGRVRCPSCNKFFTNRTNTILHGSPLEFEQVYLIAALSAFAERTGSDRIAARREIARIAGLHPDSIKNWQAIFTALETPLV